MTRSWLPTQKWYASLVCAAASIAASWIATGAFDDVERGMTATALVSLAGSYLKSNSATPGGVPVKARKPRRRSTRGGD